MNPHLHTARSFLIALLLGIAVLGACHDDTLAPDDEAREEEQRPILSEAIVSNPVAEAGAAAAAAGISSNVVAAAEVAYVSFPPGTIDGGEAVTITNRRTGSAVEAFLFAGGLDPVPIGATPGDTLDLDIRVTGSDAPLQFALVVPDRRPPIVVRTDPPPRKRDVPLNAAMLIVFSEPIDAGTIAPPGVQLLLGDVPVSAVRILSPDGLWLDVRPDSLLRADTEYRMVVTNAVADLDGDPLETTVEVTFTTGSAPASTPPGLSIVPGDTLRTVPAPADWTPPWGWFALVVATITDSNGDQLRNVATTWSSSDPTVVNVQGVSSSDGEGRSEAYLYRGSESVPPDTVTITARGGGFSGSATVILDWVTFDAAALRGSGAHEACFLTTDGAAYCRGNNGRGAVGVGVGGQWWIPAAVVGGHTFQSLSAGAFHVCGLEPTGSVYCWGYNEYRQLGDGTTSDRGTPVPVGGALSLAQISAGRLHTCGLTPNGAAYCWGYNSAGQLGDGSTTDSPSPVLVAGGLTFAQISAGANHTCGLTPAGEAYCWGSNTYGQLGNGSVVDSPSPTAVAGGLTFADLAAGSGYTCGVTLDGRAYCWGFDGDFAGGNGGGLLGNGSLTNSSSPEAVALPGGTTFTQIRAGATEACALASDGAAYCWGYYYVGGAPLEPVVVSPSRVAGGLTFVSVSSGFLRSCGVTAEPAVYCWSQVAGEPVRVEGQR